MSDSGLPRIRLHDLRHTHATLLLKSGQPTQVVQQRLGHSDPSFTIRVYGEVIPGMAEAAADAFADLIEQGEEPGEAVAGEQAQDVAEEGGA